MKHKTPWLPDFAQVTVAENLPDSRLHIRNVRNFSYTSQGTDRDEWKNIDVDPNTITSAWYYVAPLIEVGKLSALFAHTFLAFEFTDGTQLAFSIEARRREGEKYNPFTHGLLGTYKLTYLWGTLSDFESRRTIFYNQSVERYEFILEKEKNAALLKALLEDTNKAVETPYQYHSVTAQCTNEFIKIFRKIHAGPLPWHMHLHLTTLSPKFLARHGVLDLASKKTIPAQS